MLTPDGWIKIGSPTHPNAEVFEGPCANCKITIRRSAFHFQTREIQLCSNKCKGEAREPKRDDIRWKKGRAFVYRPDHPNATTEKKMCGYVPRSRAMMEDHLGRLLLSTEIVHHKNDDKTDDRIDNFEVTNRSDHRKHHAAEEKRRFGNIARWRTKAVS